LRYVKFGNVGKEGRRTFQLTDESATRAGLTHPTIPKQKPRTYRSSAWLFHNTNIFLQPLTLSVQHS
jgi:hypothetical protein